MKVYPKLPLLSKNFIFLCISQSNCETIIALHLNFTIKIIATSGQLFSLCIVIILYGIILDGLSLTIFKRSAVNESSVITIWIVEWRWSRFQMLSFSFWFCAMADTRRSIDVHISGCVCCVYMRFFFALYTSLKLNRKRRQCCRWWEKTTYDPMRQLSKRER